MRTTLRLAAIGVVLVIAGAGLMSEVKIVVVLVASVAISLMPIWWIVRGIHAYRASRRFDE